MLNQFKFISTDRAESKLCSPWMLMCVCDRIYLHSYKGFQHDTVVEVKVLMLSGENTALGLFHNVLL